MKKTILASLVLSLLSTGSIAGQVEETPLSAQLVLKSKVAQININDQESIASWLPQLLDRFNQLPEVQAQGAQKRQAELNVRASQLAVYNPELGVDAQSADTNVYGLSMSQTLDWGDKQGVANRIAQLESEIVLANIRLERSSLLADILLALVQQHQSHKALAFRKQKFQFAKAQLDIAHQQVEAGELPNVALQLMQLELSSDTADYAMAEQEALSAEANVSQLIGDTSTPLLMTDFIHQLTTEIGHEQGLILPALTPSYQNVLLAKLAVEQAKADVSADPTISLSAEKEGSDNKIGLGLSIPLKIRNDHRDMIAAVAESVTIAEQEYLAKERVLKQQERQFYKSLPKLSARYHQWRDIVQSSGQQAADALAQQWRSGDINTSDYLQGQRQLATSYLAGLSLEAAMYQSWLSWMGQSGMLESYFASQFNLDSINKLSSVERSNTSTH